MKPPKVKPSVKSLHQVIGPVFFCGAVIMTHSVIKGDPQRDTPIWAVVRR